MSKQNVYDIITQKIIETLEQGSIPWRKPWQQGASLGSSSNYVSKKPYTGINAFLTAICSIEKGYTSPFWLTYKQAQTLGGTVKKGEKSLPILFFKKLTVDRDTDDEKNIPMARYYVVFNLDQCEGIEAPSIVDNTEKLEFNPIESAEKLVAESPMNSLRVMHEAQQAFYHIELDYINMPNKESFASVEEYYSTLFHELTHATGHKSRLDRPTLETRAAFGSPTYNKEELVAELGSAFLCSFAGISAESTIINQAAYIQGFLKLLKGDSRLIVQAASQAQKAADYIRNVKKESEES